MNRILAFVLSCIAIVGIVTGVIYFASLDETQHKIEYVVDGEVYHTQFAFVTSELTLPKSPTRTDYDFDGWYYDDNTFNRIFNVADLEKGALTEDIKVYAKWKPHTHVLEGTLTKKEDGKIEFYVYCTGTGCEYKDSDTDANVESKITKNATCLENGEITYSYSHLGTVFTLKQGIAKTGHMLHGKPISQYLNDNGQISIDTPGVAVIGNAGYVDIPCGGTAEAIYVCSYCSRSINITAVKNHDFSNKDGSILELVQMNPGNSEYYIVNAKCGRSDCDFVTSFQAETALLKSKVITPALCKTDGTKQVTYENNNSSIGKIKITLDNAIIPATDLHVISGRPDKYAKDYQNPDGSFNYYHESGTRGNKTYTKMFSHNFANAANVGCGEYFEGYFECATCFEYCVVTIYKNHNYETLEYTEPTCSDSGYIKEKCRDCLYIYDEVLLPKEHSIVYNLKVNPDNNNNLDDNSFSLYANCSKCDYAIFKGEYENNNAALSHRKTLPTCGREGNIVTTLTVTLDGASHKLTCTQIIPATLKHILNGKVASEFFANADGTYDYTVDGIKLNANASYLCSYYSGTTQPGHFVCETCEKIGIESKVFVDVYVNHTGTWSISKSASCSKNGTLAISSCNECGTSAEASTYEETIPSTGVHAYKYTMELVQGNTFNLTTECRFVDCSFHSSELVTPTKTLYKTATCSEKGIYRYTYNKNGTEVICDIEYVDVMCHRVNGQYIVVDNTTVLPSNMVGIIMPEVYDDKAYGSIIQAGFVCEDCGRYILVNVKIVQ